MPKPLGLALALLIGGFGTVPAARADSAIVLAANGCGPAFFRTLAGECVPNRRIPRGPYRGAVLPPPCPPGFLRDPNPATRLCYPVY